MKKYIRQFEEKLTGVDEQERTLIKKHFFDILRKQDRKLFWTRIFATITNILIYTIPIIGLSGQWILSLTIFLSLDQNETMGKYISTGATFCLYAAKVFYDVFGFAKKVFEYEESIKKMKTCGVRWDGKSVREFVDTVDKELEVLLVTSSKVDTVDFVRESMIVSESGAGVPAPVLEGPKKIIIVRDNPLGVDDAHNEDAVDVKVVGLTGGDSVLH